ncbi:hypothetical protein BOX15_Mlig028676g4 [Macrostomum lignano]|uniref:Uncharacterized protein n=2 Tax=Macrostomum lignano TaxID=282301 RepID=A0A267H2G4_9PLAT|nr:hypothetical protein BOX15_Mlig028676g2 [Macrostomum lignano]PAA91742.1 hypothetical protein BOX15_Mlig028676g4 [Macrostomum lignano]
MGNVNLLSGRKSQGLALLLSLMVMSISCCQTSAESQHKGKFLYCGPASPVMIDWLCRSIKHLESFGIKDGYIDPAQGYLPLSAPPPWKKRSGNPTSEKSTDELLDDYDLPDEATIIKRGIHAHVAMSLCCRRMCDARVFCKGY